MNIRNKKHILPDDNNLKECLIPVSKDIEISATTRRKKKLFFYQKLLFYLI